MNASRPRTVHETPIGIDATGQRVKRPRRVTPQSAWGSTKTTSNINVELFDPAPIGGQDFEPIHTDTANERREPAMGRAAQAKQKVFLIVDNLRVHDAKAGQDWLARHKVEIEIFYLPAYAPEHNPDEYLNNDLKQTIKNKPRAKTRDDLVAATSSILISIQKRPNRVKSYFHAKHVRYAA